MTMEVVAAQAAGRAGGEGTGHSLGASVCSVWLYFSSSARGKLAGHPVQSGHNIWTTDLA